MSNSSRTLSILLVTALVSALVALSGCGSQTASRPAPTQPAAEPAPATPQEEPLYTPTYKTTGKEIAVITTARGVIKLEFYATDAPNHVANFIELAKKGIYDGTTFHRVEPGFVVQGGDPYSKTGEGSAGTGGPGYRLAAEFNSRKHEKGTLAMARSADPDSAGSQFYICLAPQPGLDGQYTVFGKVIEGMDVVEKIAVGDVMTSVKIEEKN
ncbi:MAG: peptidylprolyl isomerase [Coriobacteriaceae bacterium]|nr:peptidylprolyl isomerase [Coriobacteriaceae bacterium]